MNSRYITLLTSFWLIIASLTLTSNNAKAASSNNAEQEKQEYTTVVDLKRGEKWWGLFVSNTPIQPFSEPFKINTADYPKMGFYVPIMVSNLGRYIWSDNPFVVEFDGENITLTSNHEKMVAEKGGKTLRDAYIVCCHKNFPPKNTPPNAALFTNPIYETSIELGHAQGQQEILDYAQQIVNLDLPVGTIVIPDGWRSISGNFKFNSELYPEPELMISKLHEMGFKVMLTVTPYLPVYGKEFHQALENGYLIRDEQQKPTVFVAGEHYHLTSYDISDASQFNIIKEGVKGLKSLNIDFFRFECMKGLMLIEDNKQKDKFLDNWLTLENEVEVSDFHPGGKTPLAAHLSNIDLESDYSWEKMVEAINEMVAAGLAGFPYSHISGKVESHSQLPSDNTLLAAWLQFTIGMPISKVEFAPWRIKDTTLYNAIAETIKMRVEVGEYFEELITSAGHLGEPLLRHMEYQFPKMGFADCNDQYMLGAKYLIAPNVNNQPKRMVRLPKGTWIDKNGNQLKGPVVTEVDCSDGRIPSFMLKGK